MVPGSPGMNSMDFPKSTGTHTFCLIFRRPNLVPNYIKYSVDFDETKTIHRKIKFESTQIDEKSNEWSNFTHSQFWRENFRICHFIENLRLARQCHRITLLAYASHGYMLYESLESLPRRRDSHDLLRQQSENVVSRCPEVAGASIF